MGIAVAVVDVAAAAAEVAATNVPGESVVVATSVLGVVVTAAVVAVIAVARMASACPVFVVLLLAVATTSGQLARTASGQLVVALAVARTASVQLAFGRPRLLKTIAFSTASFVRYWLSASQPWPFEGPFSSGI